MKNERHSEKGSVKPPLVYTIKNAEPIPEIPRAGFFTILSP
jgi:hypothetical protein